MDTPNKIGLPIFFPCSLLLRACSHNAKAKYHSSIPYLLHHIIVTRDHPKSLLPPVPGTVVSYQHFTKHSTS